jgi:hypothetical protein
VNKSRHRAGFPLSDSEGYVKQCALIAAFLRDLPADVGLNADTVSALYALYFIMDLMPPILLFATFDCADIRRTMEVVSASVELNEREDRNRKEDWINLAIKVAVMKEEGNAVMLKENCNKKLGQRPSGGHMPTIRKPPPKMQQVRQNNPIQRHAEQQPRDPYQGNQFAQRQVHQQQRDPFQGNQFAQRQVQQQPRDPPYQGNQFAQRLIEKPKIEPPKLVPNANWNPNHPNWNPNWVQRVKPVKMSIGQLKMDEPEVKMPVARADSNSDPEDDQVRPKQCVQLRGAAGAQ